MRKTEKLLPFILALMLVSCATSKNESTTLKDALKEKFYIGAALNTGHIAGTNTEAVKILETHFSSIVAENCMKSQLIHPEENRYDFAYPDQFVELGEKNGMFIIGHCLIWHSQLSSWFLVDEKGEDVSAEVLKARMKEHITTIVSRYKGRIHGWDVVNEAIMEDGSYRNSKFYQILGEEFIPLAFQYAHEADPDAELYYNDYNEWHTGKRATIVRLIRTMKERGIRIDAIGMQGHVSMTGPSIEEYEAAILDYTKEGVNVMITELDLSILPPTRRGNSADIMSDVEYQNEINPYIEAVPDSVSLAWNNRFMDFFNLFLKHSDKISRVTLWGISDGESWKNNHPVRGRTDYPLLFDRSYQPKPIVQMIIDEANKR